jgi:hypothetical protein
LLFPLAVLQLARISKNLFWKPAHVQRTMPTHPMVATARINTDAATKTRCIGGGHNRCLCRNFLWLDIT